MKNAPKEKFSSSRKTYRHSSFENVIRLSVVKGVTTFKSQSLRISLLYVDFNGHARSFNDLVSDYYFGINFVYNGSK